MDQAAGFRAFASQVRQLLNGSNQPSRLPFFLDVRRLTVCCGEAGKGEVGNEEVQFREGGERSSPGGSHPPSAGGVTKEAPVGHVGVVTSPVNGQNNITVFRASHCRPSHFQANLSSSVSAALTLCTATGSPACPQPWSSSMMLSCNPEHHGKSS